MYRFLFSPRWLGWLALVVLLAGACSALGMWQLDRRDQLAATIERIEANYDRPPIRYSEGTVDFRTFNPAEEWLPIELTGTYDTANQLVVRNRPFSGRPGYEVLVPLQLADGSAVIINRGWLPIGNNEAGRPDAFPQPPEGEVTVTARIKPGEPQLDRGAPDGQIASIDLPRYEEVAGYEVQTGAYGLMSAENPAPATSPQIFPRPYLDSGPHLSYSMQWFAFGGLLFVGFGYAARQQQRTDEEETAEANGTVLATPVRRHRRPTAEEEEDAFLDARGY
ncbi:SURF1 family protein [Arthrobacter sp. H20]|uniref:SURF1 family cytochrome oxidase biogenesis protein n=1 Tax=Arthrobacter sp. H20 TaxID=1267981 RepID=UPI00047BDCE2|nr:SURF1 family protein [Arthrobacter sp. H20]